MKVIAIDNQKDTLDSIVGELISNNVISDVKGFCDPLDALDFAKSNPIDAVFLEVKLPGLLGIELAKRIRALQPKVFIVFVTDFCQYAVEAFKIRANGYVMKPATREKLMAEIENLQKLLPTKPEKLLCAQCFGHFEVFRGEQPVKFGRAKAKETLAYLIDRGGASVSTAEIAAVLWEDKEYTRSKQIQTQTVITDLLKSLKAADAEQIIRRSRNSLSVDPSKLQCDYYDYLQTGIAMGYAREYMMQYSWAEFKYISLK